jgi:hypothetical protein
MIWVVVLNKPLHHFAVAQAECSASPCSHSRLGDCGKDDLRAETTCSSLPHQTGVRVAWANLLEGFEKP